MCDGLESTNNGGCGVDDVRLYRNRDDFDVVAHSDVRLDDPSLKQLNLIPACSDYFDYEDKWL